MRLLHLSLTISLTSLVTLAALSGCNHSPGNPAGLAPVSQPREITNFTELYRQNCSGCHGEDGNGGAAIAVENETYLAIADNATIRRVTSNGVPGTSMPAFAETSGGMLTDAQIGIIVKGIRERGKLSRLAGVVPPSYAAKLPGDPNHGAEVYGTFCSSCHGPDGRGTAKASSIVDPSFLALASDQYLRTIVIAGRPELGAPDWRGNAAGTPMSETDVSDVVAWLSAQRTKAVLHGNAGNSYPGAK